MIYLASVALIVFGLLCIFAKDGMWELTQIGNQMKGVASERTDWWDTSTTIGGIAAVVLGAIAIFVSLRG